MRSGSGLSGLQLKLSPEPRVEQRHAQEVKPGRRERTHRTSALLSFIVPGRGATHTITLVNNPPDRRHEYKQPMSVK